ncbi:hypothetical protein ACS0TY_019341 [Phlomoides rotata]
MEDGTDLVSRLLGVSHVAATNELRTAWGSSMKLKWLVDNWKDDMTSDDPHTLNCAARAYMMYVIRCVLFAGKSGSQSHFLRILDDVEDAGRYAWGTAALAYLYRQLGLASRYGVKQVAGFIPLLEAWIYEHFPFTQLAHNRGFNPLFPLARKWVPPSRARVNFEDQVSLRERLDALTISNVEWNPYAEVREQHHWKKLLSSMDAFDPLILLSHTIQIVFLDSLAMFRPFMLHLLVPCLLLDLQKVERTSLYGQKVLKDTLECGTVIFCLPVVVVV